MSDHNSYLAYKRDTKYLLYWAIHTSNAIIKSLPAPENGEAPDINVTGQITVSELIAKVELISKHMKDVPSIILRLFQSAIAARTKTHAAFQALASFNPDIEQVNVTHKYFIDALTKAFQLLGGEEWMSRADAEAETDISDESIQDLLFNNKFSALSVGDEGGAVSDAEDSAPEATTTAPRRKAQKKSGKGKKKGKKGKKAVPKPQETADLESVPIESFRIIESTEGIMTDYLMAVYALASLWASLRTYLQGVWRDVAYSDLNSAVAGTLSNIAVSMVKKTETAIFIDFPDHESYETVTKTITRGDPDKVQGNFEIRLYAIGQDPGDTRKMHGAKVDVREQLMMHTYQDLVDFAVDYQQTRSGAPTKRMLAEIKGWDPLLNLRTATFEQRIKWRRAYTINWLYDLVNVFSCVVIQRIAKGERHVLENVDWSPRGPWDEHRRLYGLSELAGFITSLAMQKPGTDIRKRIYPRHVFELQCIVDAFAVSRGWSITVTKGHVLRAPAAGFRPRRDVDLFLDRENKQDPPKGFLKSVDILRQMFQRSETRNGGVGSHESTYQLLEHFQHDFIHWLGESKYKYFLTGIPPSRFAGTDSNGMWEYSPYLCGAGLAEGLEFSYLLGMHVWDMLPEPVLLVHLHNMLAKKGYFEAPRGISIYLTMQGMFQDSFFPGGKVPDGDFYDVMLKHVDKMTAGRQSSLRSRRQASRSSSTWHELFSVKHNVFARENSLLTEFRAAGWDVARIVQGELDPMSALGMLLLSRTKVTVNTATGKPEAEDTPIVRRAKAAGMPDEALLYVAEEGPALKASFNRSPHVSDETWESLNPGGYSPMPKADWDKWVRTTHEDLGDMDTIDLLGIFKEDITSDVCGANPRSGLNYLWLSSYCMIVFNMIEDELKARRNRTYVRVYEEEAGVWGSAKRAGLALTALQGGDEECLKVMAKAMLEQRISVKDFAFWGLDSERFKKGKGANGGEDWGWVDEEWEKAQCSVM